jgi:hypothetical protein
MFYLLMSSGSTASESSIGYHSINRDSSSSIHLFTEDNPIIILPVPTTTGKPDEEKTDIYDECGKSKSCFGMPADCVARKNCLLFSAVIVKDGIYEFEMMSPSK